MTNPASTPFSWELGDLIALDPELIITPGKKDKFEEFFLALALVFNDLKSSILIQWDLHKHAPKSTELTAWRGQWIGLNGHMGRLSAGIVHELFKLVRENEVVLQDARFSPILNSIPLKCQELWKQILKGASDRTPDTTAIEMIRNTSVFHYYNPRAVADAFRAFFYQDKKIAENNKAYLSCGEDMDATRFYYVDAAARRSMVLLANRKGAEDIDQAINKFVDATNFALSHLVKAYIDSRKLDHGKT